MQATASDTNGESFSELIQLYHYAETQIKELKGYVQTIMENVGVQQKKLTSNMRNECLSYINEGLEKVKEMENENDAIETKINGCGQGVNATIDETVAEFIRLYDKAQGMLNLAVIQLKKEPASSSEEEIIDEIDDHIDDFIEKFEATVTPHLDDLLSQIRMNSITVPLNVKKCIDEILNKIR